jgi:hypothetical protein
MLCWLLFCTKIVHICWHFCAKNDNKLCAIFVQAKSKQTICPVGVSIKIINQNFQTDFVHQSILHRKLTSSERMLARTTGSKEFLKCTSVDGFNRCAVHTVRCLSRPLEHPLPGCHTSHRRLKVKPQNKTNSVSPLRLYGLCVLHSN